MIDALLISDEDGMHGVSDIRGQRGDMRAKMSENGWHPHGGVGPHGTRIMA